MRVFITGGTGFIGRRIVVKLMERGDDVVALVRSPRKADWIRQLGLEIAEGDVSDESRLAGQMEGADALIHGAGAYTVGLPARDRPAMYEANVRGTQLVLAAGIEAGVPRIVYVSTANVFGNTRGSIVDESQQRSDRDFLSYYDETKYLAHRIALERMAEGAPIVIVQPGGVYGPDDHSEVGSLIDQMRRGTLRFMSFPQLGFNLVYVDDVAGGILLALDRGRIGESYVLGGEITTLGAVIAKVARLTGHRPPRLTMPVILAKASIPFGPWWQDAAPAAQPPRADQGGPRRHVLGERCQSSRRAWVRAAAGGDRPSGHARRV